MITNPVSSLTRRARDIYADRRMAAKWVLAARNLRAHNAWILEGAAPKWGCRQSRGQTNVATRSEATRKITAILKAIPALGSANAISIFQ
jgi:hypothetical protein